MKGFKKYYPNNVLNRIKEKDDLKNVEVHVITSFIEIKWKC